MAEGSETTSILNEINTNLVELNNTIKSSTEAIYKAIISSAKIQSAKDDYERNTAIKEADDYIKLIKEE
jgi:site-specific DNA-adenine methylase